MHSSEAMPAHWVPLHIWAGTGNQQHLVCIRGGRKGFAA